MKKHLLLLVLSIALTTLHAQTRLIGFYNLENLFDTIHDENKNDYEFLPDGKKQWNSEKYKNKLQNMSYAITRIGEGDLRAPQVLGVCEVENVNVLFDLTDQPELQALNYAFIHEEGPDTRGIDVALLYQKNVFQPLYHKSYPLVFPEKSHKTRDQLLVCGLMDGDTLYFLVNHWPSRVGGAERSAPNRTLAAQLSRRIVDTILMRNPASKIFIMGDFNDDPTDTSITKHLQAVNVAQKDSAPNASLYNLSTELYQSGKGTLEYRKKWNLFDQIIVSKALVQAQKGLLAKSFHIYTEDKLIQQDGPYAGTPLRTHGGEKYLNGYSDHFPTFVILQAAE